MISAKPIATADKDLTTFKYVERGYRDSIVLIPGWASDYRIFATLDLRFNYFLPIDFSPYAFEKVLLNVLKQKNISRISLFGWSLGGFMAQDFASRYPDLIDKLILVSIRKRYETETLAEIREHLKKNKRGYLYKFYGECFSNKDQMHWFRENLLKVYCKELELDYLLKGLDCLENAEIETERLNGIKGITIIHGEKDLIAPIEEARDIKGYLPHAKFVCMKDAGHIPFLKEGIADFV